MESPISSEYYTLFISLKYVIQVPISKGVFKNVPINVGVTNFLYDASFESFQKCVQFNISYSSGYNLIYGIEK